MSFVGDESILKGIMVNVHVCESTVCFKQRKCNINYTSIKLFKNVNKNLTLQKQNKISKRTPTFLY